MTHAASGPLLKIRGADPREVERLREIAITSKSAWGYELERVREWAARLDFSPERLHTKEFYVAEFDGCAVGWAALLPRADVCWLDDLWIEPACFNIGIGTRLFQHAAERGRVLGATRLEWEAEPHALGFYEKMGGRYLRDSEPGPWGRINAVIGVDL